MERRVPFHFPAEVKFKIENNNNNNTTKTTKTKGKAKKKLKTKQRQCFTLSCGLKNSAVLEVRRGFDT